MLFLVIDLFFIILFSSFIILDIKRNNYISMVINSIFISVIIVFLEYDKLFIIFNKEIVMLYSDFVVDLILFCVGFKIIYEGCGMLGDSICMKLGKTHVFASSLVILTGIFSSAVALYFNYQCTSPLHHY